MSGIVSFDGVDLEITGDTRAVAEVTPVRLEIRRGPPLSLLLFGQPGRSYTLESTAELGGAALWTAESSVTLSVSPPAIPVANTSGARQFFRARESDSTDPVRPGRLQFKEQINQIAENRGVATITVRRVEGSAGTISVNYSTSDGTAKAGEDYSLASGTLGWVNGDTADKTFSVTIINDLAFEPEERVNLTLSNPTGDAALGSPTTATLDIIDDDLRPVEPGTFKILTQNLDFGNVMIGQTSALTFQLTNGTSGTGTGTASIASASSPVPVLSKEQQDDQPCE